MEFNKNATENENDYPSGLLVCTFIMSTSCFINVMAISVSWFARHDIGPGYINIMLISSEWGAKG